MIVPLNDENLKLAASIVKKNGVIVYPTETVYGLGANPFSRDAVKKVFDVKKRKEDKPIPIIVSSLDEALKLAYFSDEALKLAKSFWPGPLTLILPRKPLTPDFLGSRELVGVRVPNNSSTLKLVKLCGGFLTGTSANISGQPAPVTAEEAEKQVGEYVDLIIDGGKTFYGLSSTVVDISTGKVEVLRLGPIKVEDILKVLGNL
ncbi:MAG: L-threonylcarbamoyladenylate synthase [Candidatus Bathyarchaeota archaeon]|nr:L-threonylcarbamoyladenylate synthase [Candidatus Bathyarchaeota archaeon]